MNKLSIHNKKTKIIVGIIFFLCVALIFYASLKLSEDSLKKVVDTKNNETITFNLLAEGSETTLYQSELINLTISQCGQKGVKYYDVYSGDVPKQANNVKQYYQFYKDDNGKLHFDGEVYEWETRVYENGTDSTFTLDRSKYPYEVPEDRGYILVKFYVSEDAFDEIGSHYLIKSEVNGKKLIAKTLSDFYYTGYKSYRITMEDIDSVGTDVLILADNVSEENVVEFVEFFAGI